MISFASIWAIVIRHARAWKQDINVMLAGFYWPMLDLLIWGYLGTWIAQTQTTQLHSYKAAALLGILLWQIIGRGCLIISTTFTEELWSNNVVNLFSLPLRLIEWIGGTILFYILMMIITVIFCMLIIPILYDISFWYILSTFFIFAPPLFIAGIWIGFTCLQIMVTLGKRGIELGFIVGWFFLPFCGAYYPVEVLPQWGKVISAFLPMSYVFAGMRAYVMRAEDPAPYLMKGYLLGIPYAICAIMLFVYLFNRSKQKGLARLAD